MADCIICGATDGSERFTLREMLYGTREEFEYLLCPSCGVLRIAAVPLDLERHYPPGYNASLVSEEPAVLATGLGRRADLARNRYASFGAGRIAARILRRWTPRRSHALRMVLPTVRAAGLRSFDEPILDVGCGSVAVNLDRLRIVGFRDLLGIDPFLEHDTTYRGIPLQRRSIHEVDGRYRLIMFNHSFEHVPDPHDVLAAARDRLVAGGVIVIRMPVMDTWLWRTYGTDWVELDAPRHLFVYTTRSVEIIARTHGLRVRETIWEGSGFGFAASEQVRRDIACLEPASYLVARPGIFDEEELRAFDERAQELNDACDGGRAAYFLEVAR